MEDVVVVCHCVDTESEAASNHRIENYRFLLTTTLDNSSSSINKKVDVALKVDVTYIPLADCHPLVQAHKN